MFFQSLQTLLLTMDFYYSSSNDIETLEYSLSNTWFCIPNLLRV